MLPTWTIVALPLGLLLAGIYFLWRYVRRGTAPLHRAAALGNLARLEQLLADDPKAINTADLVGMTPLQYAAHWGQEAVTGLLLERGADLTGNNGLTPLHYAAAQGHEIIAKMLIEHGSNVNAKASSDHCTPLHSAVANRHADLARLLLDNNASIEAKTKSDWTVCHFAADHGDEPTMQALWEHQADCRAVNSGGQTPAEVAQANGHKKVAAFLRQWQDQASSGTLY